MKNFHEKWYAGEVISVGIGQGAVAVTPIQLLRALSGIASDGHLVRPHVVSPTQLPAQFRAGGAGDVSRFRRQDSCARSRYVDDDD